LVFAFEYSMSPLAAVISVEPMMLWMTPLRKTSQSVPAAWSDVIVTTVAMYEWMISKWNRSPSPTARTRNSVAGVPPSGMLVTSIWMVLELGGFTTSMSMT
jgi:hypothetical protein